MDLVPIPRAPRALVPVNRTRPLALGRALGNFLAKAAGAQNLEPRKGATDLGVAPLLRLQQAGLADKPIHRGSAVTMEAMHDLAERDDIIMSIRRTIRMAIGDMAWKIVPDIEAVKADLQEWEKKVLVNLALPGLDLLFAPRAMSLQIYEKANGVLRDKLQEAMAAGEDPSRSPTIRGFFENVLAAHEAIALSHVRPVQQLLEKPSAGHTSLRSLLDLVIDDLTLYDAACVIKNPTLDGRLGELYTQPGQQITIYRQRDGNIPPPPHVAYDWSVDSKLRAYYNKDELTYFLMSQQNDGYGKSPLESIVEQMVGSIYGDAYLLEGFANNNLPYAAFDLGPNVSMGEKQAVERAWDERMASGMHRVLFLANKEGVKGFLPIPAAADKDDTTIEKLKFWANRKTAAYGLSLGDIGFTEDLHRSVAETQSEQTQSRGINSFMESLEAQINQGIIKGKMWVRDDPEQVNSLAGSSVPCFPFGDVKLSFTEESNDDLVARAGRLTSLIVGGIMTVNEARKEEDLPAVAGGDTLVIGGGSLMKVEDLPNIPPPQAAGPPGGGPPGAGGDPSAEGDPSNPGQEQPGAPGQKDTGPPAHSPFMGNAKPGGNQPQPKPKGGDVGKAMNEVEALARKLAKMADSTEAP